MLKAGEGQAFLQMASGNLVEALIRRTLLEDNLATDERPEDKYRPPAAKAAKCPKTDPWEEGIDDDNVELRVPIIKDIDTKKTASSKTPPTKKDPTKPDSGRKVKEESRKETLLKEWREAEKEEELRRKKYAAVLNTEERDSNDNTTKGPGMSPAEAGSASPEAPEESAVKHSNSKDKGKKTYSSKSKQVTSTDQQGTTAKEDGATPKKEKRDKANGNKRKLAKSPRDSPASAGSEQDSKYAKLDKNSNAFTGRRESTSSEKSEMIPLSAENTVILSSPCGENGHSRKHGDDDARVEPKPKRPKSGSEMSAGLTIASMIEKTLDAGLGASLRPPRGTHALAGTSEARLAQSEAHEPDASAKRRDTHIRHDEASSAFGVAVPKLRWALNGQQKTDSKLGQDSDLGGSDNLRPFPSSRPQAHKQQTAVAPTSGVVVNQPQLLQPIFPVGVAVSRFSSSAPIKIDIPRTCPLPSSGSSPGSPKDNPLFSPNHSDGSLSANQSDNGATSPGNMADGSNASGSKKKKRKRCGVCEPCMTKQNCGDCSSCKNRRTGHQICKMRKCVELRKKTQNGPIENHNSPPTTLPLHNSTAPDYPNSDSSTAVPPPNMSWPPPPPMVNGYSSSEGYPKMNHFPPQAEMTKAAEREGRREPIEAVGEGGVVSIKKEQGVGEAVGIPVPAHHHHHHHHPHAKYAFAASSKPDNATTLTPSSGKGPGGYSAAPVTATGKPTGSPSPPTHGQYFDKKLQLQSSAAVTAKEALPPMLNSNHSRSSSIQSYPSFTFPTLGSSKPSNPPTPTSHIQDRGTPDHKGSNSTTTPTSLQSPSSERKALSPVDAAESLLSLSSSISARHFPFPPAHFSGNHEQRPHEQRPHDSQRPHEKRPPPGFLSSGPSSESPSPSVAAISSVPVSSKSEHSSEKKSKSEKHHRTDSKTKSDHKGLKAEHNRPSGITLPPMTVTGFPGLPVPGVMPPGSQSGISASAAMKSTGRSLYPLPSQTLLASSTKPSTGSEAGESKATTDKDLTPRKLTPAELHRKMLEEDMKEEMPDCGCLENDRDEAPYYTHLGAGRSVAAIREMMEKRFGHKGNCIRIEKLVFSGKEGKSSLGCPIAKWILRRSGPEEKILVLVRNRPGHHCETAYIIIATVAWEGCPRKEADNLYDILTQTLPSGAIPTVRRCAVNEEKTCACQGFDPESCGASFSFGCSWSMYYNSCKFARSKTPKKFKLQDNADAEKEEMLENKLQWLATEISPLYRQLAPDSFRNQVLFEKMGSECRLGWGEGRPFSGVTACMDFCAHAHRDQQNMNNGCTVVVTLTKDEIRDRVPDPGDEQLHVLPLYYLDNTDEMGSMEGQQEKVRRGSIEVLTHYRHKSRLRPKQDPVIPKGAQVRTSRHGDKNSPSRGKAAAAAAAAAAARAATPQGNSHHQSSHASSNSSHRDADAKASLAKSSKEQSTSGTTSLPSQSQAQVMQIPPHLWPQYQQSVEQVRAAWPGVELTPSSLAAAAALRPELHALHPMMYESMQREAMQMNAAAAAAASLHPEWARLYPHQPRMFLPPYAHPGMVGLAAHEHLQQNQALARFMSQYGNDPYILAHPYMRYPHFTGLSMEDVKPDMNQLSNLMKASSRSERDALYNTFSMKYGAQHPGAAAASGYGNSRVDQMDLSRDHHTPRPSTSSSAESKYTQNPPPNGLRQDLSHHPPASQAGHKDGIWRPPVFQNSPSRESTPSQEHHSYPNQGTPPYGSAFHDRSKSQGDQRSAYPQEGSHQHRDYPSFGHREPSSASQSRNSSDSRQYSTYPQQQAHQEHSTARRDLSQSYPSQDSKPYPRLHEVSTPSTSSHQQQHDKSKTIAEHLRLMEAAGPSPSNPTPSALPPQPSPKPEEPQEIECISDSEECFRDPTIGGVAIALSHGSILFEAAKRELHATTSIRNPHRQKPTRISLVFYQHKHMNFRHHGLEEYERKMQARQDEAEETARLNGETPPPRKGRKRRLSASDDTVIPDKTKVKCSSASKKVPTKHAQTPVTNTVTTLASTAFPTVTGPYQKWV
ncbi:methylcytosine dioxygenase TET2-like isoform X2 [Acanthaster planci]|uniref:Methylcytosine dioxygenase TET n=1 Tax=Acanthaster planci TaxID=133434 RepID=A0A8B7Y5L6_ACAPL|nr:methylcytosine dioxygenase TET2-like isoform X2 [Acanthaster planci]